VLTSAPVWAIVVGHTCAVFGIYLVLTTLPTYMKYVLRFDIQQVCANTCLRVAFVQNGFLSAVPYLAYFCVSQIASHLADYLRSHHIINTTHVRKLAMLIGGLAASPRICRPHSCV
jgi:hypothetical protein